MGRGQLSASRLGSATSNNQVEPQYRLATGEDARTYFEYGSYNSNYSPEEFVRDSRTVSLYGGIDFERSGPGYESQRVEYEDARRRWQKQIQYNRQSSRDSSLFVSMSSNRLKTVYKSSTSEEQKRRIASELNSRGFYRNSRGNWTSRGGGR